MAAPPTPPPSAGDPYQALGVPPHVGAGQIEAAYRFTLRIYAEEGVAWRGFLTPQERGRAIEAAVAAYAQLNDRTRAAPSNDPVAAGAARVAPRGPGVDSSPLELPPELRGSQLRALRERRGATLADIVALSKVSARFLEALEDDEHARLPGRVFARGFLVEYGRALGLDGAEVAERYLRYWSGPR